MAVLLNPVMPGYDEAVDALGARSSWHLDRASVRLVGRLGSAATRRCDPMDGLFPRIEEVLRASSTARGRRGLPRALEYNGCRRGIRRSTLPLGAHRALLRHHTP